MITAISFFFFITLMTGLILWPFIKEGRSSNFKTAWKNQWTNGRSMPIATVSLVLYLLLFAFYPEVRTTLFSFAFFGLTTAYGLIGAAMKEDPVKPLRYELPKWAMKIALFIVISGLITSKTTWGKTARAWIFNSNNIENLPDTIKGAVYKPSNERNSPFGKTTNDSHPIPPHRVEDEEPEVAKLAREKLANQPDLLERCTEESGLRQHKKVGDTFDTKQVLRGLNADGTEGPAVGVCQINEVANGAFCKAGAFDIFTIEGNLDCALALYARDGLAPWYTDPRSPSILPFDATIGSDWTVLKIDGRHFDYHIDKATGTELMANGNPVVIDNPANLVLPGIIKTFAIRSTMGGTHAHIIETTRP